MLIDDRRYPDLRSALGTRWQVISDQVMGGVSQAELRIIEYAGRACLQLAGDVSLANNGGFLQMALDLDGQDQHIDASAFRGIELDISGNDESYNLHLRTADLHRPWQSYRAVLPTRTAWRRLRIAFSEFTPHRTDAPLDLRCLRRLGLVAIGREFHAEIRLAYLALY